MNTEQMKPPAATVTYTVADLFAAARYCRLCKWLGWALTGFLVLVVSLELASVILAKPGMSGAIDWSLVIGILAGLLYLRYVSPLVSHYLGRRRGTLGPWRMDIEPDAFRASGRTGDHRYKWASIHRIVERGGRLFVFVSPNCPIVVPRKSLDDPGRFEEFAEQARSLWESNRP